MAANNAPTPSGVNEAFVAGAAAVKLMDRQTTVTVVVDGRTVAVPVILNADGNPVVPANIVELAEQMAEIQGPRRKGCYAFDDLASLIEWTKRFKTSDSAAYFRAPSAQADGVVQVVIDDLPATGSAGAKRQLEASLAIELNDSLQRWVDYADKWLTAESFCEHVDARSDDFATADLVSVVRNIGVREETSWKRTSDENGNVRIVAEDNSGPTTKVPKRFAIAVPTFAFDDESNVAQYTLSLRCKIERGKPQFQYSFENLSTRLDECLRVAMSTFREALPELPAYLGGLSS